MPLPIFHSRWIAKTLCVALLFVHGIGQTGVFTVSPVRMHMAPKDRALAVTVSNDGDTPMVLQAEIYQWAQTDEGADQLTPTEDLVLAPPILKLAPKTRQVVRLAMTAPRDASRQLTYRMVLREVPEALGEPRPGLSVTVALAMSLPIFVTPPVARRDLQCELSRQSGKLLARCANRGTAYAQVRELHLWQDGQELANFEGGAYILPGARRTIELKTPRAVAGGGMRLVAKFDDGSETSMDQTLR